VFKRLTLTDFQSHRRTEIDFHANFNAIVGMSNVGKTSIARALEFILYGKWENSWVRQGAKSCRIELVLDSGTELIREKGEKLNKYTLRVPGQAEQVYEGFGTDVPEPISSALRIFKAKIDEDTLLLNLSGQHEPLFLFSKPGSFKAKILGKLSGAHYLDYALRELNKDRKALSAEKAMKSKELEDLQKQEKALSGIDLLQGPIKALEYKDSELYAKRNRLEALKKLFLEVQAWKRRYAHECQLEAILDQVPALSVESVEDRLTSMNNLSEIYTRMQQADRQIIKLRKDLEYISDQDKELYSEILNQLETAQVCPTCFSTLDNEKLSKIRSNLCNHGNYNV
jgi:DNA repair exonuclease SbcCD ATPase subunit